MSSIVLHQQATNQAIYSDKQLFLFKQDCHDLFSGCVQGNMGLWRYDDGTDNDPAAGAVLWERLIQNATTYYVSAKGDQSIEEQFNRLLDFIGSISNIVDLGPGAPRRHKINLLRTLISSVGVYAPVDVSPRFLKVAPELENAGIHRVSPVTGDFTKEKLDLPGFRPRLFLFLGSTIGNLIGGPNISPEQATIKVLTNIRQQMSPGDKFILGFDSCQDEEQVLNCYQDPYSIDVMKAPLFKMARDLPISGTFDPYAFDAEFQWFPESGQCAHTVVARSDQRIILDHRVYSIPKRTRLYLSNSYKFSMAQMKRYLYQAGFVDVVEGTETQNPMKIVMAVA